MSLFELLKTNRPFRPLEVKSKNLLSDHILDRIGTENIKIEDQKEVKKAVHLFCMAVWRKWKESHGNSEQIYAKKRRVA